MKQFFALACLFAVALSDHDFSSYPFSTTLSDAPLYELYWNFDNDAETISFVVNVETTGWVGLGLSPNGQMPNSDVVIGWVTDDGQTMFHDRFAAGRIPPTIDEQQDWKLISGEEESGFTILEFSRKYITCDDNDLPITTETARLIWSLSGSDPSSEVLTFSNAHLSQGSRSINLLGGLPNAAPDPADLRTYDVLVNDITIPAADTTYWCAAFKLPEDIRNQTRYITKFSPIVTEGNEAHVHHLLIYLCTGLNDTHVGNGDDCDDDNIANQVRQCRGGNLIAAWAVGGDTFVFPENVAFPFGGEGFPQYLVMELHYDNPTMKSGVMDSSGIRFSYTSMPREHDAGILQLGHRVTQFHIIPPNTANFITTGIFPAECTDEFIPQDGIRVFANALHTHVVGHGLTVQHLRQNTTCGGYEELKPIDNNLMYDFDFQQITHLPKEVVVLPGDIIKLFCYYGTMGKDTVTLGGLGTRDEMCLTFLFYYPKIDISIGISNIVETELNDYFDTFSPEISDKLQSNYEEGLNDIDWNEQQINSLQTLVNTSTQGIYCGDTQINHKLLETKFPEIKCPYVAPEQCPPLTTAGTQALTYSMILLMILSLMTAILG